MGIYFTRLSVVGANLVSLLLIAFLMEPAEFGEFAFMFSAALTTSAIVSFGAPALFLRELSAALDAETIKISRSQALRLVVYWPLSLLLILLSVALILREPLANQFGRTPPTTYQLILLFIFAGQINFINLLAVLYRVQGYVGIAMAFRDAGPQAVMLVAAAAATFLSEAASANVFSIGVATQFLGILFCILILWPTIRERLQRLSATLPNTSISGFWGTTVANMSWTQIDILLGGLLLSASDLGQYQIVKRIANFANMPQIVVNWLVVVGVGSAFSANRIDDIQAITHRAMRLSVAPLIVFIILITLAAPILLGSFGIGMNQDTLFLLLILLLGASLNVLFGPNYVVASQCKMEKSAFLSRLLGLGSCALPILALHPTEPYLVALAYLLGTIISNLWLWRRIHFSIGIDTSIISLMKPRAFRI